VAIRGIIEEIREVEYVEMNLFFCLIGLVLGIGLGVVIGVAMFPREKEEANTAMSSFILLPDPYSIYRKEDIKRVVWNKEAKKTYVLLIGSSVELSCDDEFGGIFVEIALKICDIDSVNKSIRRHNSQNKKVYEAYRTSNMYDASEEVN